MTTMLEAILYSGAGWGQFAWILPVLFFAVLAGGLFAYFNEEKKGLIAQIGSAIAGLAENPYKLLAYTAGIALFVYITTQIPAMPYVTMITGLALYIMLALDISAWIASAFKK